MNTGKSFDGKDCLTQAKPCAAKHTAHFGASWRKEKFGKTQSRMKNPEMLTWCRRFIALAGDSRKESVREQDACRAI